MSNLSDSIFVSLFAATVKNILQLGKSLKLPWRREAEHLQPYTSLVYSFLHQKHIWFLCFSSFILHPRLSNPFPVCLEMYSHSSWALLLNYNLLFIMQRADHSWGNKCAVNLIFGLLMIAALPFHISFFHLLPSLAVISQCFVALSFCVCVRSPTYKPCVTAAVTGWTPRLLYASSVCTVLVEKMSLWCCPSYRAASVPAVRVSTGTVWPQRHSALV